MLLRVQNKNSESLYDFPVCMSRNFSSLYRNFRPGPTEVREIALDSEKEH